MKDLKYCENYLSKIGNINQLAGIRRFRFSEGKAEGVEAAEVHTGSGLEFTVLPGRGMDIAWTSYKGVPLNYMSKTGIASPAYYENNGMNWLNNFFAGTLTTCGLLNVGGPQKVTHPVIGERELGLHGRITNCAAEQVGTYEDFEDGNYVMKVSGRMQEASLHAEHLTLRREVATAFGKKEFTITDKITNFSQYPQPVMILYHINFGYPLLDNGTRIVAAPISVKGLSDLANNEIDRWGICEEPKLSLEERCFAHDLKTDSEGKVHVLIINDELELGVELVYKKEALPFFNEWKMLNEKEYVVGLEPGNALPVGINQMGDDLEILSPGASKIIEITYRVLDGAKDIAAAEQRVKNCK